MSEQSEISDAKARSGAGTLLVLDAAADRPHVATAGDDPAMHFGRRWYARAARARVLGYVGCEGWLIGCLTGEVRAVAAEANGSLRPPTRRGRCGGGGRETTGGMIGECATSFGVALIWDERTPTSVGPGHRMKVERKLFDFFVKKQKQNENMKTKTKICGMKREMNFFFWRKWKQKWNNGFGGTDAETEIFVSD
jgi:hypothetical protein